MDKNVMLQAEQYRRKRTRHKTWKKIVTGLGAVVVFITTYSLILPAITMEPTPTCGYAEHQHSALCYELMPVEQISAQLICQPEVHAHKANCHDADGNLICTLADCTHPPGCYDAEGNLICGLADCLLHSHGDTCYYNGQLICSLPEVAEHIHNSECFAISESLICDLEADYHVHSESCCTTEIGELICDLEETEDHAHTDLCFEQIQTLICEIPENPEGHSHSPECTETNRELICSRIPAAIHTHDEHCLNEVGLLSCGILSAQEHTHTADCLQTLVSTAEAPVLTCPFEEHTHTEGCMEYPIQLEVPVDHQHDESCYTAVLICGISSEAAEPEHQPHEHTEACYETSLVCTLQESTQDLVPPSEPTAEAETTSVDVTKYWSDNEIGAEYIEVQLYADGVKYGTPVQLSAANGWTYTWEDLLKYSAPDTAILYTIEEILVPGYLTSITRDEGGSGVLTTFDSAADIRFLITNTRTDEDTSVSVTKQWAGRSDGMYPDSAQVILLQNGAPYGPAVTLNEENGWYYRWEELPLKLGDTQFTYSVEEVQIEDYTATIQTTVDEDGALLFELTNTWSAEYVPLLLSKADATDPNHLLPGAQFRLYLAAAEGTEGAVPIPGAADAWGILTQTVATGDDGTFRIDQLWVGKTYYLVETTAPVGYNAPDEPIVFTAEKDENGLAFLTVLSGSSWATAPGINGNGDLLLQIQSKPGYVLPETGGAGTYLYTMGGLLLMAAVGIFLLYNHKPRGKEDFSSS